MSFSFAFPIGGVFSVALKSAGNPGSFFTSTNLANPGGLVMLRENLIGDFLSEKRVEAPFSDPGEGMPSLVCNPRCAFVNPGGASSPSPGVSKARLGEELICDSAVFPLRSPQRALVKPGGTSRGNPGGGSKTRSPQAGALLADLHGESVVPGKYNEKT